MTTSEAENREADLAEAEDAPEAIATLVVTASAPVFPTEDVRSVHGAIANLFPALEFELSEGEVVGSGSGPIALARFRRRLRELHIRDTARSVLRRSVEGDSLAFRLNKQTAVTRVANFSTEGQPLGDIAVTVSGADPQAVADWLCEIE